MAGCPNDCVKANFNDFGIMGINKQVYDIDRCIGCGSCVDACKHHATGVLSLNQNGKIDKDACCCVGCGECSLICPTGAWTRGDKKLYRVTLGGRTGKQNPRAVSYTHLGAATVKATSLNVRSGAGTGYSSVGRLAAGAAVTVIGEQRGTDGNTWYQIQYTGTGGAVNTGYVSSVYIRLPVAYTKDSNFEAYLTSQGFPESYKNGLRQLHAQYPNWVFKAKNTGLDWNTVKMCIRDSINRWTT